MQLQQAGTDGRFRGSGGGRGTARGTVEVAIDGDAGRASCPMSFGELGGDLGARGEVHLVGSLATKAAGMKATRKVHILRHTFCSTLASRGAPAAALQKLAGHTDLATTQRYMHLSPEEAARAIDLLEKHPEPATIRERIVQESVPEGGSCLMRSA